MGSFKDRLMESYPDENVTMHGARPLIQTEEEKAEKLK